MDQNITFKLGCSYKFNTIAPSILSAEYKNMVLVSILSSDEALKSVDVYGIHEQLKQLPNLNIPLSAKDLTYLKFTSPQGTPLYIAQEYLTGVELISNKSLVITIENYTESSYSVINEMLRKLGFENIKFELIEKNN